MADFKVLIGDCAKALKTLPEGSVDCCVTSPPYYGLRDYGHEGQVGLELTPEMYINKLVSAFREVRRVLRDDGTLWVNIGDSYASRHSGNCGYKDGRTNRRERLAVNCPEGMKDKDLIGIPWMLAFALRADGWYLRQDIIWHKTNPMPESVRDRATKAHEYIFLLSKSRKYYFDSEAFKEDAVSVQGSGNKARKQRPDAETLRIGAQAGSVPWVPNGKRNRRSVWQVATKPYKGGHFATFPPDLIEPCILAGSRVGGLVLDPFGGSGTTAGVALRNERNAIICELNPDYCQLIHSRISDITGRYFEPSNDDFYRVAG